MEEAARVVLTMPAEPSFLRLARLAAADAATRAGFTVEEVEDLRLAIDELCGPLMGGRGVVALTFSSTAGRVDIEGHGPSPETEAPFAEIADAIIAAVVDTHAVVDEDGARAFRAVKYAADQSSEADAT